MCNGESPSQGTAWRDSIFGVESGGDTGRIRGATVYREA